MKFTSDVSGKEFPSKEKVSAKFVRQPILDIIKKEKPAFDDTCSLSMGELNEYREKYITDFLEKELGDLTEMETKVVECP